MRKALYAVPLVLFAPFAHADSCETAWDGEAIVLDFAGMPAQTPIRLQAVEGGAVEEISLAQLRAFRDAVEKVAQAARRSPQLVICSETSVNAFAYESESASVVALTLGMLRLVDGDPDEAAAVAGHEVAHHARQHGKANAQRDGVVALLALVVGVVAQAKGGQYNALAGRDATRLTSRLASAKFSRDEEREADELAVRYMVSAGYNPDGALRLMAKLGRGGDSLGLFLDSHPGAQERSSRLKELLASEPELAAAVERKRAPAAERPRPLSPSPEAEALFVQSEQAWRAREPEKAAVLLRKAADLGYSAAQTALGVYYAYGHGVKRDDAEAVRLYGLAAQQGDMIATWRLGTMHEAGRGGLPRDLEQAARLYRTAADEGLAVARASLANFYEQGRGGLVQDAFKAARLYRFAVQQGLVYAHVKLGAMYLQGRGVAKDEVEAARLFRLAADAGNASAQMLLGAMYEQGLGGLAKDEAEAVRLYRLSAAQSHPSAQLRLGRLHAAGRGGLAADEQEAIRLFRLAAAQGDERAREELARRGLLPAERPQSRGDWVNCVSHGERKDTWSSECD